MLMRRGRWRRRHSLKSAMLLPVHYAGGVVTGVMLPATWSEFRADVAHDVFWIFRHSETLADWIRTIGDRITDAADAADGEDLNAWMVSSGWALA